MKTDNELIAKEEVRTGMMTLQECKEEIAKLYGFDNWDRIDFYMLDSQDQTAQRPYAEERLNDEVAELYASQFKSQSEAVGWISVENKFIDEEIAYLKSCNSANRWGEIENQFAAGMICAYERLIREREYFTRKVSVGEEKRIKL